MSGNHAGSFEHASLYVVKDIKKGDTLTSDNIRSIRPGKGLHPRMYPSVLGKTAVKDMEFGHPLEETDFE